MGRTRKERRRNEDSRLRVAAVLTREKLQEFYCVRGQTMEQIARRHGCSKQYVSVLCGRYAISRSRCSSATQSICLSPPIPPPEPVMTRCSRMVMSMPGIVAYLFRHTETEWNSIFRYQGRIDTALNATGRLHMERITSLVQPGQFSAVYSSPLSRARCLAESVACKARAPLIVDDRLTEMAMGPWEGLTRVEIEEQFPAMLNLWHDRPDEVSFPGGETVHDVALRARSFMEERFLDSTCTPIAVVTHDTVVKVAVMLSLGLGLDCLHRFRMRNGSISVLRGGAYAGSVESIGNTSHLSGSPFELLA